MSEIDQQFIEYVVKSLVGKPDAVHIDRRIDEKGVLLELTVDPEDLGRVIGKRGATAQSLRTLLRALGTKNDARYNLKIIDNGEPRPPLTDEKEERSAENEEPQNVSRDDELQSKAPTVASIDEHQKVAPVEEDKVEQKREDGTSDRMQRAREELADLDDLDV